MKEIADILRPNLAILFIGFNPGLRSAETGHHFAGHTNKFWKLLAASALTPILLQPAAQHSLLDFGYGISNIVARPSRAASEITQEEYTQGRIILKQKLQFFQPKIACYVGIGIYKQFAQRKTVECGQQSPSVVAGIIDFVVPSPSGLNRILFATQLEYYKTLKKVTNNLLPHS
jgi:TDG/mug DNA glycosylase family protein